MTNDELMRFADAMEAEVDQLWDEFENEDFESEDQKLLAANAVITSSALYSVLIGAMRYMWEPRH